LLLTDTEQYIWQTIYDGDDTIFPENCGALDDERGEYFHRYISAVEKTYQAKCSSPMLAGYCWKATGKSPGLVCKP
jgi:hypothetical protein